MTDEGWRVELAASARRDIKRLDRQVQARILDALDGLTTQPPTGDVKLLSGQPPEWRLRVGDWRVRFTATPRAARSPSSASCPADAPTATDLDTTVE